MNKILIGCGGVLLLVAIAIGVLILQAPRFLEAGKTAVKNVIAEEMRVAAMEGSWQPPSDHPEASWLPVRVGDWQLDKSEATESIPAIGLQRAGQSGVYRSERGLIEVSVVPVAEAEKADVLASAQNALRGQREVTTLERGPGVELSVSSNSSRVTTTRGNRTHVRIGDADHTRFWWVKGYLFVFRAYGQADSETFPEELLRAVKEQASR